eukprot:Ihof_evm5s448 gene=Ihof_evmTU5s448
MENTSVSVHRAPNDKRHNMPMLFMASSSGHRMYNNENRSNELSIKRRRVIKYSFKQTKLPFRRRRFNPLHKILSNQSKQLPQLSNEVSLQRCLAIGPHSDVEEKEESMATESNNTTYTRPIWPNVMKMFCSEVVTSSRDFLPSPPPLLPYPIAPSQAIRHFPEQPVTTGCFPWFSQSMERKDYIDSR